MHDGTTTRPACPLCSGSGHVATRLCDDCCGSGHARCRLTPGCRNEASEDGEAGLACAACLARLDAEIAADAPLAKAVAFARGAEVAS